MRGRGYALTTTVALPAALRGRSPTLAFSRPAAGRAARPSLPQLSAAIVAYQRQRASASASAAAHGA